MPPADNPTGLRERVKAWLEEPADVPFDPDGASNGDVIAYWLVRQATRSDKPHSERLDIIRLISEIVDLPVILPASETVIQPQPYPFEPWKSSP